MKKFSHSGHSSLNELNITPLLDLAFVLLVIFIITTPQLTNDLEMSLPSPQQNRPKTPPPKIHRVAVDRAGNITFNAQRLTLAAFKQTVFQLKAQDPNPSVVVLGSGEADYEKVIGVLDVLQQAEVAKVGLATETAP